MSARTVVAVIGALLLAVALSGCWVDTSFTRPPKCGTGQALQRLPSHQHYMWTCAPGGPRS